MPEEETFSITRTSRISPPRLSFKAIKEEILGSSYSVSLVFIGDTVARRLNKTYKGKDRPANVLSFPLSEDEGEIFIDLRRARDDAPRFDMSTKRHVAYLFIHGLLHLKGMEHGGTMEKEEERILQRFKL